MKKLFSNVGKKFYKIARFNALIGILAVVASIPCLAWAVFDGEDEMFIISIAALVAGIIVFNAAFVIYSFGQLVNDVHDIRNKVVDDYAEK